MMNTKEYKIVWETNYWWGWIIVKSKDIEKVREALDSGIKKYKSKYFEKSIYRKIY